MSNENAPQILADLPENLQSLLAKANIQSAYDVFTTSTITFEKHGIGTEDMKTIRTHYAARSFPGFVKASDCATRYPEMSTRITFGCTALDRLTHNGVPVGGITEISGEAGSGKSQMCLQLALMVQLPRSMGGLAKAAVIICTEGPFAARRLEQMTHAVGVLYGSRVRHIPFARRIFVGYAADVPSLLNCVSVNLPALMAKHDIGLVVIDSVGGIFRTETTDFHARSIEMRRFGAALVALSKKYSPCAVICVNQVTAVIHDSEPLLVPCLGLAWANLVSTRIQLHRTARTVVCGSTRTSNNSPNGASQEETIVRQMEIVFAPHLAPAKAEFVITADGVTDVPQQDGV